MADADDGVYDQVERSTDVASGYMDVGGVEQDAETDYDNSFAADGDNDYLEPSQLH